MPDGPRCRVLVVEDEALIAILMEDMVRDFGSEVVGPSATLEHAIRLASDDTINAAILDINLAGAVVFPVADALRERGTPIIFATGYGAKALPPRFAGSLTVAKPFTYASLASCLREALANDPCSHEAA